jgi:HK97 family phage portal protein
MKLLQRLRLAYEVARGNTKAVANLTSTYKEGQAQYPEISFENNVRHGWRKNELIFACINKTANTASQVQLMVHDKEENRIDGHPLIDLVRKPNPDMDEFDFWASVVLYQKLGGRAAYEIEYTRGGQPIHLWPLQPDRLSPIIVGGHTVAYEYKKANGLPATLAAEDVLDFKLYDPLNRFHSWAPVSVAARVGDVDNSMTDFLKVFMEKGGVPAGLIKTTQKFKDEEEPERLRRAWEKRYGGYQNWTSPAILDQDAEYQKTGLSFVEMGFDTLDARSEARICAVLDVPPIIIGAKVGLDRATYSNYGQARKAWWEDTLIPLYKNFGDTLNNQLLPKYVPTTGERAAWDFENVPALREETMAIHTRALESLKSGGITLNEYRILIGEDDLGAAGDIFYQPMGMTPVPKKTPVRTTAKTFEGKATVARNAPDDDERRALEDQLENTAAGFLTQQLKDIVKLAQQIPVTS